MGGRRLDGDLLTGPDRLLVGVVRVWMGGIMVGGEPAPTASARQPSTLLRPFILVEMKTLELSRVEVVTSHDSSLY